MNNPTDQYAPQRPAADSALALVFTAGALLIFLCWQAISATKTHSVLRAQRDQRAQLVTQSLKVQADLQKLANDLVELSKTDAAAKALVDRYQIKVAPPATQPSPSEARTHSP